MKDFRYKKCFITNRGEILKRISSTLKKMDIQSVAIDDGSEFSRKNVDILLNERSDISTYLDKKKLIDTAKNNGIDMIHPGYGFLSEDSEFAYNTVQNNIVWIGPNHSNILISSNKNSAKEFVKTLGIPTIKYTPNFSFDKKNLEEIKFLIKDFKYPLIIKSIFSGGGKGIRIVKKEEDLEFLLDQCTKESERYFPNTSLMIEEYLEGFSHVEVQILSDRFGNSFILGTRQCSIQRRNQKLLEEAPACISESIFKKLRQYSLDIIKKSCFESIGTIEFLVNKDTEEIYFMEINPRLQVEHTVTESIYDIDLVELQIKIAHDFNLKDDIKLFNKLVQIDSTNKAFQHSIEVRLCSETPFSFLPCSGRKKITPVFYKDHIRWDNGVELDQNIEVDGGFDSLLSKIIVKGSSRDEVIDIFNKKLFPEVRIEGVSNWDLLKSIFRESDFLNNKITTQYLQTHIKQLEELNENIDNNKDNSSTAELNYTPSLEEITRFAFSNNQTFSPRYNTVYNSSSYNFSNSNTSTSTTISSKYDTNKDLDNKETDDTTIDDTTKVKTNLNSIYPPVPGKILSLKVKKGDSINKDDVICTIESMKMEIEVTSKYSGMIESITDSSWVNTSDAIAQILPCSN